MEDQEVDPPDAVVLEAVVPQVLEPRRHHCHVITLGQFAHYGSMLIKRNRGLLTNAIDATILTDPARKGGPWGTSVQTQGALCRHPLCEGLVREVISRILSQARVVIYCNHGHHRSVGVAEIAVKEIERFLVVSVEVTKIHVDAKNCTPQQWEDLWYNRI